MAEELETLETRIKAQETFWQTKLEHLEREHQAELHQLKLKFEQQKEDSTAEAYKNPSLEKTQKITNVTTLDNKASGEEKRKAGKVNIESQGDLASHTKEDCVESHLTVPVPKPRTRENILHTNVIKSDKSENINSVPVLPTTNLGQDRNNDEKNSVSSYDSEEEQESMKQGTPSVLPINNEVVTERKDVSEDTVSSDSSYSITRNKSFAAKKDEDTNDVHSSYTSTDESEHCEIDKLINSHVNNEKIRKEFTSEERQKKVEGEISEQLKQLGIHENNGDGLDSHKMDEALKSLKRQRKNKLLEGMVRTCN